MTTNRNTLRHALLRRSTMLHVATIGAALLLPAARETCRAQPWHTGTRFAEALQRPISIASSEVPLRQTLQNLSKAQQIAIVLDRRIDPSQRLEIDVTNLPLREVIERVATRCGAEATILGDVVYVGPPDVAGRLRTVVALNDRQLRQLPTPLRAQWRAAAPLQWSDLATPREILNQLARDGRVQVEDIDSIPHDLWAAASTPPLPLALRMALVLAQFDRTLSFVPDSPSALIVPMPAAPVIERRYPAGVLARKKADRWMQLAPDARIEVVGQEIHVTARIEDHERLHQAAEQTDPPMREPTNIEQVRIDRLVLEDVPLGQLLESLASRLGLEFKYDPQAIESTGVELTRPISLNVEQATVDELLAKALDPIGLNFRRVGRVVEIVPRRGD